MEETTENNVGKTYTDPVTGKFVKGNPGGGKPKGETATTKTKRAFRDYITDKRKEDLVLLAIERAESGDNKLLQFVLEQLHGKAPQSIQIEDVTKIQIDI